MDAIDVLTNISNTKLIYANNLRYCLVGSDKVPYTVDGKNAKPNSNDDFVPFADLLEVENLGDYAGVGISIKASNVCAIDVDHCFETKFDFSSIDDRGKYIYITEKEMGLIEKMFMNRGRINKGDLIKECNRIIRFEPTEEDKIKIAEEQQKTLKELEDELNVKK